MTTKKPTCWSCGSSRLIPAWDDIECLDCAAIQSERPEPEASPKPEANPTPLRVPLAALAGWRP